MSQVTLFTGAVWGIVGAGVMLVIMQAVGGEDPPPFAVFWSTFFGDGDPSRAMPHSLILHVIYAALAGITYVAVFTSLELEFAITGLSGGILWGVVWGVVLFLGAAIVWVNGILGMEPDRTAVVVMALAHLGFGLTLGILSALVPHLL